MGGYLIIGALVLLWVIISSVITWWKKLFIRGVVVVRQDLWDNKKVIFKGRYFDIPLLHRSKMIDITTQRVVCEAVGFESVRCRDFIKADLSIVFFVRIPNRADSVLLALEAFGSHCEYKLDDYFSKDLEIEVAKRLGPIFNQKIRQVASRSDFLYLYEYRDEVKNQIQLAIDEDELFGYIVEDLAFDDLEQTPLEFYDLKDELDSRGIDAIEECIAKQNKQIAEEERREIEG